MPELETSLNQLRQIGNVLVQEPWESLRWPWEPGLREPDGGLGTVVPPAFHLLLGFWWRVCLCSGEHSHEFGLLISTIMRPDVRDFSLAALCSAL